MPTGNAAGSQVERAAGVEQVRGVRAADLQPELSLADVDQRMRPAGERRLERAQRRGPFRLLHQQQPFVGPKPQCGPHLAVARATGLGRQFHTERPPAALMSLRGLRAGSKRPSPESEATVASGMQALCARVVEHGRGHLDGDRAVRHRHVQGLADARAAAAHQRQRDRSSQRRTEIGWSRGRAAGWTSRVRHRA